MKPQRLAVFTQSETLKQNLKNLREWETDFYDGDRTVPTTGYDAVVIDAERGAAVERIAASVPRGIVLYFTAAEPKKARETGEKYAAEHGDYAGIADVLLGRKIRYADEKPASDKALDERLANIFIASGIPPHIKGYQFLREAVKQSVRSPEMINNITKQLYPAVAEKFGTSPSKVERAIRHAIEVAWSRGKIDNINSIYGIKVFSKGEKPTNGELIALVSDKMMIECS